MKLRASTVTPLKRTSGHRQEYLFREKGEDPFARNLNYPCFAIHIWIFVEVIEIVRLQTTTLLRAEIDQFLAIKNRFSLYAGRFLRPYMETAIPKC